MIASVLIICYQPLDMKLLGQISNDCEDQEELNDILCGPWIQDTMNIVPPCCPTCTVKVYYAYRYCTANECEISPHSWILKGPDCLTFWQTFEPNYPNRHPSNSIAFTNWMSYCYGQISNFLFTQRYNALKTINQESSLECPFKTMQYRYYNSTCTASCVFKDYMDPMWMIPRFVVLQQCAEGYCCKINRAYCWDKNAIPPGPVYDQTVTSNPPNPVCPTEKPDCSVGFPQGIIPANWTYLYTTDCGSPCGNPPEANKKKNDPKLINNNQ